METLYIMTDNGMALRLEYLAAECEASQSLCGDLLNSPEAANMHGADAFILREAAQLMREREGKSLLTECDWKGMYEAQERDMAALRKEQEALKAGREEAMSLLGKLMEAMAALRKELEWAAKMESGWSQREVTND